MTASRIGLNLYSLREFAQTPADIAQTLRRVKQIGYDYVQLSGIGKIDPKELKQMLDGEGLGVCATHIPLARLQTELDTVIDEHKLWGCRNAAVGAIPETYRGAAGYARFAREGSEIGRRFAAHGITFSYHNHYWEFERYNGRTGMDILFEEGEPQYLFAEIDTYWVQYGGGDPAGWIEKMEGRVPLVHFKDMGIDMARAQGDQHVMLPVGEGNLNWPAILEACRKADVEWTIVEQDWFPNGAPFESVALSLKNMKAMGL